MLAAIVLSTLMILVALALFHAVSKGAHPFGRVLGYWLGIIGLVVIWQYELIDQEPNITLVVLIGVGALVTALGLMGMYLRPGWNRTR